LNEEQKQAYLEDYKQEKEKGVKFYPDIIYKDLIVAFALFLLLVGLAIYVGVAAEPPADPSDSSYIPRPEWYFLFLFQLLKYFPGQIEWVGTVIIPTIAVLDGGAHRFGCSVNTPPGGSSFRHDDHRQDRPWTGCIFDPLR
jgi:quinol-cytochrome oxidoreductase complex cytochrome b subunit